MTGTVFAQPVSRTCVDESHKTALEILSSYAKLKFHQTSFEIASFLFYYIILASSVYIALCRRVLVRVVH